MTSSIKPYFSDVPIEIFERIVDYLPRDDGYTLSAASKVARKWNTVLRKRLFASLNVGVDSESAGGPMVQDFRDFLNASPDVRESIETLSFSNVTSNSMYFPAVSELTDILDSLPRLKNLSISSLWLLSKPSQHSEEEATRRMNRPLEKLTLKYRPSNHLTKPCFGGCLDTLTRFSEIAHLELDMTGVCGLENRRTHYPAPRWIPKRSVRIRNLTLKLGKETDTAGVRLYLQHVLDLSAIQTMDISCTSTANLRHITPFIQFARPPSCTLGFKFRTYRPRMDLSFLGRTSSPRLWTFLRKLRIRTAEDLGSNLPHTAPLPDFSPLNLKGMQLLLQHLPPSLEHLVLETHLQDNHAIIRHNNELGRDALIWRQFDRTLSQYRRLRRLELAFSKWSFSRMEGAVQYPLSDAEKQWYKTRFPRLAGKGKVPKKMSIEESHAMMGNNPVGLGQCVGVDSVEELIDWNTRGFS
ncbi:hypothetical protein K474DRAFT_1701772 [Panus rudis PR-1116 ss-1]|nr:hypothetical protein K474DRAFT_1701772 [Panus rudis PR-1116 ss-1]